jgi:hypothetical protein
MKPIRMRPKMVAAVTVTVRSDDDDRCCSGTNES